MEPDLLLFHAPGELFRGGQGRFFSAARIRGAACDNRDVGLAFGSTAIRADVALAIWLFERV